MRESPNLVKEHKSSTVVEKHPRFSEGKTLVGFIYHSTSSVEGVIRESPDARDGVREVSTCFYRFGEHPFGLSICVVAMEARDCALNKRSDTDSRQ